MSSLLFNIAVRLLGQLQMFLVMAERLLVFLKLVETLADLPVRHSAADDVVKRLAQLQLLSVFLNGIFELS